MAYGAVGEAVVHMADDEGIRTDLPFPTFWSTAGRKFEGITCTIFNHGSKPLEKPQ